MAKLVLLITPLIESAHDLGDAWDTAGAGGVTYIESHGLHTLRETSKGMTVLPGMMSLFEILRANDQTNITMLSIVADDAAVDQIIAATEGVIGDLKQPDNGILVVIDVERTLGVRGIDRDID